MDISRRNTIKKLVAASGAIVALPFWAQAWQRETITVHNNAFAPGEQELLAAVADTIIPAGNSIGALSVGVDKFLQKLISDCYEKDVQENVRAQLLVLDTSSQQAFNKSFVECAQTERENILTKFSQSENKGEKGFFDLMKMETIRGFNTSKEVMTMYLHYKVMPGHYYGCVDVKS